MSISWPIAARQARKSRPERILSFRSFLHGLNTSVSPEQLKITELSTCVNFLLTPEGSLETRRPVTRYTNTGTISYSAIKAIAKVPISGIEYELLVDANYCLYYLDATKNPVYIGTLEGETQILGYNDIALLMDGSYLKYLDDTLSIKMAYDDGTGTTGYQFDNSAASDDMIGPLGNGTNFRIAYKFTTQNWTSGYTIPPTKATVKLSVTGSPAAEPVYIRIRKVIDDSIIASDDTAIPDASLIPAVATEYNINFVSDNIVEELYPNTEYYLSVEYGSGDASNYVNVHGTSSFNSTNLINNGGFYLDVDPPENWVSGNNALLTTETGGKAGNCMKIMEYGGDYPYAKQAFTAQPGYHYNFRVYIKAGSETEYRVVLYDVVNDGVLDDSGWRTETAGDWSTDYSTIITAPTGCTEIAIYLYSGSMAGEAKYLYYDSVTCYQSISTGHHGYLYTTLWSYVSTHEPIFSLSPGVPPKVAFGAIANNRPFLAGDPDNPSYVWFGNLTHLDWSTPNGGGYIGAVDDTSNSYEVGGLATLFGNLYVYGKSPQPYLCKLTGASPTDYALPMLFQKIWTTHRVLMSVGNDLWSTSKDGVSSVMGVEQYGDIRAYYVSESIDDRIKDYWEDNTAIAGYNPDRGLYLLYMPNYHRILVAHTKLPYQGPVGPKYPWVEFELTKDILTSELYEWIADGSEYYLQSIEGGTPGITAKPSFILLDGIKITEGIVGSLNDHEWGWGLDPTLTYYTVYIRDDTGNPGTSGVEIRSLISPGVFACYNGEFFVGADDGYIYQFNNSSYKELDTYHIRFDMRTAYFMFPFANINLIQHQLEASGKGGGRIHLNLYKNAGYKTYACQFIHTLNVNDSLTVDEMIMDLDDLFLYIDPTTAPIWKQMNLNARSLQIQLTDIIVSGYPIFINGISFKYRGLEH